MTPTVYVLVRIHTNHPWVHTVQWPAMYDNIHF